MPELPEVETVRLTLEPYIIGQSVQKALVQRTDVIHGKSDKKSLLEGCCIKQAIRRGKQLALIGGRQSPLRSAAATHKSLNEGQSPDDGRRDMVAGGTPALPDAVVCVHLGMTGSLVFYPSAASPAKDKHAHVAWQFKSGTLVFRDPRRFGGLWTFANMEELYQQRWNKLGADALSITAAPLYEKLIKTQRPLKTALLDQNLVAGLGNIYVDEILFAARLNPTAPAAKISKQECKKIVTHMRKILQRSIEAGGSTIRDYVSGTGKSGGFQNLHKVYGRAGKRCARCKTELELIRLAGRATVFCPKCQR